MVDNSVQGERLGRAHQRQVGTRDAPGLLLGGEQHDVVEGDLAVRTRPVERGLGLAHCRGVDRTSPQLTRDIDEEPVEHAGARRVGAAPVVVDRRPADPGTLRDTSERQEREHIPEAAVGPPVPVVVLDDQFDRGLDQALVCGSTLVVGHARARPAPIRWRPSIHVVLLVVS